MKKMQDLARNSRLFKIIQGLGKKTKTPALRTEMYREASG